MKRLALSILLSLALALSGVGQDKKLLLGAGGGTSAPAGPFYVDTFTVASDVSILSHTSDSGHPYTRHFGAAYSAGDITVDATLDRIWPSGTGAIFVWSDAVPPGTAYSVTASFRVVTQTGNAAVYLRVETTSGNGEDGYSLRLVDSPAQWQLRRIDNGTGSTLGTSATNYPTTGGAAVVIVVSVDASGNWLVTADGTSIISGVTDNTYNFAGRVGIRFSGPMSATTGMHIDTISAQ